MYEKRKPDPINNEKKNRDFLVKCPGYNSVG